MRIVQFQRIRYIDDPLYADKDGGQLQVFGCDLEDLFGCSLNGAVGIDFLVASKNPKKTGFRLFEFGFDKRSNFYYIRRMHGKGTERVVRLFDGTGEHLRRMLTKCECGVCYGWVRISDLRYHYAYPWASK